MIPNASEWERMWAPYDQATYRLVLDQISAQDVVYEIGAGDLRLARQIAKSARHVYAVEINPKLIEIGAGSPEPIPDNLSVMCADAREAAIPTCVTIGVLMMRHCTCFSLYANRLRRTGCERLITNARWGMGVECVDLMAHRIAYSEAPTGWYACQCGSVGFKTGPAEAWTAELDGIACEVSACPMCKNLKAAGVNQ